MIPELHKQALLDLWHRCRARTPLVLEGDCMEPMLREGDEIVIAHGEDEPRFGDVVAFRQDGQILVHRVIGSGVLRGRRVYQLKPDKHGLQAIQVPREDLVGKVVAVRTANGRWDIESGPCRLANVFMGLRSYVAAQRQQAASPLGRALSWLSLLRVCLAPCKASLSLPPVKLIRGAAASRRRRAPTTAARRSREERSEDE